MILALYCHLDSLGRTVIIIVKIKGCPLYSPCKSYMCLGKCLGLWSFYWAKVMCHIRRGLSTSQNYTRESQSPFVHERLLEKSGGLEPPLCWFGKRGKLLVDHTLGWSCKFSLLMGQHQAEYGRHPTKGNSACLVLKITMLSEMAFQRREPWNCPFWRTVQTGLSMRKNDQFLRISDHSSFTF